MLGSRCERPNLRSGQVIYSNEKIGFCLRSLLFIVKSLYGQEAFDMFGLVVQAAHGSLGAGAKSVEWQATAFA